MGGLFSSRTIGVAATVSALLWGLALPAQAQIYRWVDANGTVHFSDEARPGAQPVQVGPISTISLPEPNRETLDTPTAKKDTEEPEEFRYRRVEISYPEHDSAFHSGNGTFTVTTDIEPPLRPSHELRLIFNGQVYAQSHAGHFLMENIDRGTHQLLLQVVEDGIVIQNSSPVTFTVHRPSLLHPNRARIAPR